MSELIGFVAYPTVPGAIGETVRQALTQLCEHSGQQRLSSWEETDVAGNFIRSEVLKKIKECDCLVADVSCLNFNVTYEVGYAIGLGKRIVLIRNLALVPDGPGIPEVGIFDTLGHVTYENSYQLVELLRGIGSSRAIGLPRTELNRRSPVYLIEAAFKTDPVIRIIARLKKKAKLRFRSFDPNENPRLSGPDAIANVAESFGVLVYLLPRTAVGRQVHNLRAAFIAGLADGMNKESLLLQQGDEPVPLDCRDLVKTFYHPEQIDEAIADFAGRVAEAFQTAEEPRLPKATTFLEHVSLGASSAENELKDLAAYYLETDAYQRALRGDVRIVVGRKGSGKSAIFHRVRDRIRSTRSNIVLDLRPEGYKLLKFKEEVLRLLSRGTLEHTITAFWEYLLLLEICYKILDKDRIPHTRDHRLYEPYRQLADLYRSDSYVGEGDFSERMSVLLQHVSQEIRQRYPDEQSDVRLSAPELTEILYVHDVASLRDQIIDYLGLKSSLWLLFDNVDKGWPTHGIQGEDLVIIRALLEATRKLEHKLRRGDFDCRTLVFLRNDIFELLVGETPDRGKESKVVLDWTDEDLLREMLRRRLVYNDAVQDDTPFEDVWHAIAVSHVDGEESSQFVIERSLMRPRALLDLVIHCRSVAINLRHKKIEPEDFKKGLAAYSSDLLSEVSLEIRDVLPTAENVLYEFIDSPARLSTAELSSLLDKVSTSEAERKAFVELLLWYGALGVVRLNGDVTFIYSVNYDMKRLTGIISKLSETGVMYAINPAFGAALEVKS